MPAPVDAWDTRFAAFRGVAQVAARDPRVRALASRLASINDLSPSLAVARRLASLSPEALRREQCAMLLRAVQSRISYVDDHPLAAPLQTWASGQGDCKSSAVLLCALALAVGCNARLLAMGWDGPQHVVCQLKPTPASPWLWAETTLPAELGEHPSDALERTDLGTRKDFAPRRRIGAPSANPSLLHVHAAARDVLVQAFFRVLNRAPSTFEAQVVQAVCFGETQYGQGWGGACTGSNNWGGVQAREGQPSCPWVDHFPDGTPFTQPMRVYATPVEGAADVVKLLYVNMPAARRALEAGRSVYDVSEAMFYSHYYGAWCPKALAKYGDAAKESFAFPASVSHLKYGERAKTEAGKACETEAIGMHAAAVYKNARAIASALGEAPPTLGSASSLSSLTPWLIGGAAVVVGGGAVLYFATRKKRAA